jgi:hypothetical protein
MTIDESDRNDDSAPDEELERLIEQFNELEAEFRLMGRSLEPFVYERLQSLAGSHLDDMLRSEMDTLKYLNHNNPKLRQAAIQLAYKHWTIPQEDSAEYERLVLTDVDNEVRAAAIRALGTCFARTKNLRIGRLLASLARNDELVDEIRLAAFTSLLRVHRNMDYTGRSPLVPQTLADIDWEFVDEYYRTGSGGTEE